MYRWFKENRKNMVKSVLSLASNHNTYMFLYIHEKITLAGSEEPSKTGLASPPPPGDHMSYGELRATLEKSYRNGNWRRLGFFERALYRAGLDLARLRGRIVNKRLLSLLRGIMGKMLRKFSDKALELGRMRAEELKRIFRRNGVFSWCPLVRRLLEEKDYILWLGNRGMLMRSLGIV